MHGWWSGCTLFSCNYTQSGNGGPIGPGSGHATVNVWGNGRGHNSDNNGSHDTGSYGGHFKGYDVGHEDQGLEGHNHYANYQFSYGVEDSKMVISKLILSREMEAVNKRYVYFLELK